MSEEQQQKAPSEDPSMEELTMPTATCEAFSAPELAEFVKSLGVQDKVVVFWRPADHEDKTWTIWTGTVKEAASESKAGKLLGPYILYEHNPEEEYQLPQRGYEYGKKSTVAKYVPPEAPATRVRARPAPARRATPFPPANGMARSRIPVIPPVQSDPDVDVPDSDAEEEDTEPFVEMDPSNMGVLLNPKKWGVFIHCGGDVTANANCLKTEFRLRYVHLRTVGTAAQRARAQSVETDIVRSINMLRRNFGLIADPDFIQVNQELTTTASAATNILLLEKNKIIDLMVLHSSKEPFGPFFLQKQINLILVQYFRIRAIVSVQRAR